MIYTTNDTIYKEVEPITLHFINLQGKTHKVVKTFCNLDHIKSVLLKLIKVLNIMLHTMIFSAFVEDSF